MCGLLSRMSSKREVKVEQSRMRKNEKFADEVKRLIVNKRKRWIEERK